MPASSRRASLREPSATRRYRNPCGVAAPAPIRGWRVHTAARKRASRSPTSTPAVSPARRRAQATTASSGAASTSRTNSVQLPGARGAPTEVGAGRISRSAARSTSAASTAPSGPLPSRTATSSPRSDASRRAFGDAGVRRYGPGRSLAAGREAGCAAAIDGVPEVVPRCTARSGLRWAVGPRSRGPGRCPLGRHGVRLRGARGGIRSLPFRQDHGDDAPHLHLVAGSCRDLGEGAGGGRVELHGGLVGLDLHDGLALFDLLPLLLEPVEEHGGVLVHPQDRHDDVLGHGSPSSLARRR